MLPVHSGPDRQLRQTGLASAVPREAIITAAKMGTADRATLVLRVYQPTNARRAVRIRTGARRLFPRRIRLAPRPMTALEGPLGHARLHVRGVAANFTFVARHALTTIGIEAVR